jgi:hypothetical protein
VVVTLSGSLARVVDADRRLGHRGLGEQRFDLGDRADEGRLADPEAAADDDLHRGQGASAFRGP